MLAGLVDHVIGIDPDRDWITGAVIDAHTTGIIATERFPPTPSAMTKPSPGSSRSHKLVSRRGRWKALPATAAG